jgi:uncharacterized protein YdeI (YjbR/CyaY-like superfamily)
VGWIDGLRKTIDAESYKIRFTPRKGTSNWSAINVGRVKALTKLGRMRPAGVKAFEQRLPVKTARYSYENRKSAVLEKGTDNFFRSRRKAWAFFSKQPTSYRQTCIWWVASGKKDETKKRRLDKLIRACEEQRRLY